MVCPGKSGVDSYILTLVFPDGEKKAWFKDSEGNILAMGSTD